MLLSPLEYLLIRILSLSLTEEYAALPSCESRISFSEKNSSVIYILVQGFSVELQSPIFFEILIQFYLLPYYFSTQVENIQLMETTNPQRNEK